MKFKVGDRVRCKEDYFSLKGSTGKVVEYSTEGSVLVRHDKHNPFLHNGGCGENGYYWYYPETYLELDKPETIVIFRRGEEVIALDKNTNKRAVAKCSPDDEFDFMVGAKLRFERLTTRQKCKVGDAARITGGTDYHKLKIGSIGIVASELDNERYHIYGLCAGNKDYTMIQLVHREHFEVVE